MLQTCISYNWTKDHSRISDFSEKNLNVFISFDDKIYPCCMTANQLPERGVAMNGRNLQEVVDSGELNHLYYDDLKNNTPIKFCVETCGK
tara:strand:+ start:1441 stop:1710 length:270 start_codon:yes stop_codon:yes gene_type:complete